MKKVFTVTEKKERLTKGWLSMKLKAEEEHRPVNQKHEKTAVVAVLECYNVNHKQSQQDAAAGCCQQRFQHVQQRPVYFFQYLCASSGQAVSPSLLGCLDIMLSAVVCYTHTYTHIYTHTHTHTSHSDIKVTNKLPDGLPNRPGSILTCAAYTATKAAVDRTSQVACQLKKAAASSASANGQRR